MDLVGQFLGPNVPKLPHVVHSFTIKIAFVGLSHKRFKIEQKLKKKIDLNYFLILHFFCFINILLAAKLSEWRLFWVQNENGRGGLDFCATTSFFSKINVTFLDVWMILVELFDISVSFRFQNFPRTNFSRYGGLYA